MKRIGLRAWWVATPDNIPNLGYLVKRGRLRERENSRRAYS
jgi:hypothetical protein